MSSSHRRRGIGKQLIQHCIEYIRRADRQEVLCGLVVNSEPAAHGFFQKLGFEDSESVELDLRKWDEGE